MYFFFKKSMCIVVCLHVCLCTGHVQCPGRPEEDIRSPGTGITDSCQLPATWVLAIEPQEQAPTHSYWIICSLQAPVSTDASQVAMFSRRQGYKKLSNLFKLTQQGQTKTASHSTRVSTTGQYQVATCLHYCECNLWSGLVLLIRVTITPTRRSWWVSNEIKNVFHSAVPGLW